MLKSTRKKKKKASLHRHLLIKPKGSRFPELDGSPVDEYVETTHVLLPCRMRERKSKRKKKKVKEKRIYSVGIMSYVDDSESDVSESSSRTIRRITLFSKRSRAKRLAGNRK